MPSGPSERTGPTSCRAGPIGPAWLSFWCGLAEVLSAEDLLAGVGVDNARALGEIEIWRAALEAPAGKGELHALLYSQWGPSELLLELLRPAQLGMPPHGLSAFLGVEDDVRVRVHHLELDDRPGNVDHVLHVAVGVAMMRQSRTRDEKADECDDRDQQASYHGGAS